MAYSLGTKGFLAAVGPSPAQAKVDAIVHWGDAEDSALILNAMRAAGMKQPFFGGDRTLLKDFTEKAVRQCRGRRLRSSPWDPDHDNPRLHAFRKAFHARFGEEPDTYSAHGYDGMNLLIWGVQAAGLNRAKIRDVLAYRTEPWPGVTGDIALSAVLDRVGGASGQTRERPVEVLPREELGLAASDEATAGTTTTTTSAAAASPPSESR